MAINYLNNSMSKLDFKEEVKIAYNKFERNFQVLQLLVLNFSCFSRAIIKILKENFDGSNNKIEMAVRNWFSYLLIVRNEYTLVYDGAIVSSCQESDNKEYVQTRKVKDIRKSLSNYQLIRPSAEGFRCWCLYINSQVNEPD
jgi:hypothetical protein